MTVSKFTLLVIDDNIDDFDLCDRVLGQQSEAEYHLTHAKSSDEGIEYIANNNIDCILLDYSLPGIGCAEVLERIRSIDMFLPVIILTGQGNESIAVTLLKAGAQDYISKNFVTGALLHQQIQTAIKACHEMEAAYSNEAGSFHILIVDDNPDDREFLIRTLQKTDIDKYVFSQAHSGAQAMDMLKNSIPDCIVLDYSLPGQNGIQILSSIIQDYPFLPVIMMTGQGNENIAVQAIKEGAHNYLVKSAINKDTLQNALHSAIENSMLERRLSEKENALVISEAQLKELAHFQNLVLANIPDMVCVKDKNSQIIQANPAFLDMYPDDIRQEIVGTSSLKYFSDEESEHILKCDALAFEEGEHHTEETISFPNGEVKTMMTTRVMFEQADRRQYILELRRDITERKKAEEEILRSNIELERFAYVASHDLQEPLRMVSSFTSLLKKKYADQLDDQAKEYIQIACDAAVRMQNLVSGLLEYARIGQYAENYEFINLNKLLDIVRSNLKDRLDSSGAVLIYDKNLPVLYTSPIHMLRVLQNLIGNALKYQTPDSKPEIKITLDTKGDFYEICVADNGIGMKPEYTQKIFEPFRRLHANNEYAGTGMGLAICRRIVEELDGRIWVESSQGKGSRFYFTIPIRKPDKTRMKVEAA